MYIYTQLYIVISKCTMSQQKMRWRNQQIGYVFIFGIVQQPQQFGSMIKYLNGGAQKLQIKHTDIALECSRYTPIDFHLAIEIDLEKFSIEFQ